MSAWFPPCWEGGAFFGFCRHKPFPAKHTPLSPHILLTRAPALGHVQSPRNGARPKAGAGRTAALQIPEGVQESQKPAL